MPKLSVNISDDLNKRLLQYALDTTDKTHGQKERIIIEAIEAFLSAKGKREEIVEVCRPEKNKRGVVVCEPEHKTTDFANDIAAQEKIRELWQQSPRQSYAKIGAQVGYSKDVVYRFVKKVKLAK